MFLKSYTVTVILIVVYNKIEILKFKDSKAKFLVSKANIVK